MSQQQNIISEFIAELLAELNIPAHTEEYTRLTSVLEERVSSRVFLRIVQSLTPEQAAFVSQDMNSATPNPDLIMEKLLASAPHLQAVIAGALGEIHVELANDLKEITGKTR